jgi:Methyltransferase domain
VHCKICESRAHHLFTEKVLLKYNISYYRCERCEFIQTESPYWLNEAYTEAISACDVGVAQRGLLWRSALNRIIDCFFDRRAKFVDFGGGTGLLVRLMRDLGFDFYRYDLYGENVFARGFDVTDIKDVNTKFELLTAFEVFEHLENPLSDIEKMFQISDSLLFSTLLQPSDPTQLNPQNWNYFSPETGQHIAFYTKKTLDVISDKFGCNLYSDGEDVHILTFKKLNLSSDQIRDLVTPTRFQRIHEFVNDLRRPLEKIPIPTQIDYQLMRKKVMERS